MWVSLLLPPLDSHVLLGQDKKEKERKEKKSPGMIAHLESESSDSECLLFAEKTYF